MEGYENFLERLQSILAAAKTSKPLTSTQSSSSSLPHSSQQQQNELHSLGFSAASCPPSVKKETSSELCRQPLGPLVKDAIMHEAVMSPGSSAGPPKIPSPTSSFSTDVSKMPDAPPRPRGHRRAQSEIAFRLPEDAAFVRELDLQSPELPTLSDDAGEELFNMYMDMEKMNASSYESSSLPGATSPSEVNTDPQEIQHSRSFSTDGVLGFSKVKGETGTTVLPPDGRRAHHQHSGSMDSSTLYNHDFLKSDPDSIEAKELAGGKLSELALLDPKRAKRFLDPLRHSISFILIMFLLLPTALVLDVDCHRLVTKSTLVILSSF